MATSDSSTSKPSAPLTPSDTRLRDKTVYVIAPSKIGKQSNLELYRRFLRDRLPTTRTHITDSIFKKGADPLYANTDQFRADDLANALTDDSAAVVWCALGGRGASRLVPYLEALPEDRKRRIREARKVFIGYSDITVLHVYLHTVYGWQTIHGTMLEQIVDGEVDPRSVDALVSLVDGRVSSIEHRLRRVLQLRVDTRHDDGDPPCAAPLRSRVVGGNLTLVGNTIGTTFGFSGAGKIVFLEDVDESPYHLERNLDHLRQAGAFDGTVAVVFGLFKDSEPAELVPVVFRRFAASVPFPVFSTDRIGHGYVNDPLPLNTDATLRAGRVGRDVSYTLTVDNVYARSDTSGEQDADEDREDEQTARRADVSTPS